MKTEITINAPVSQVWGVLMDFEQYPNWNPFLREITGEAKVGTQLTNTIQSNEKKTMQFKPEVLVVEKDQEFRWKGKLFVSGLFDGEHYFILKEENGKTLLIHGENFTGLLSGVLLKMIEEDTEKGFHAMNLALKNRVESLVEEVAYAG